MTKPLDDLDFSHLFGPMPAPEPEHDPFGRIGTGNPDWEAARGAWMDGAPLGALFGDRVFDLNDAVGTNRANQRGDVFRLQALMHREGALDALATGGPTGYWSSSNEAALRDLQKQNGLMVDGWVRPGGETMSFLRDLYRPPQGVQVSDAEMDGLRQERDAVRRVNSDLVKTLGLDPAKLDLDSLEMLRALGAARFYHHLDRQDKYKAMSDIEKIRQDNPELAGKLRGKIAESIANPVWQIPMMTPERLKQTRQETKDILQILNPIETLVEGGRDAWRYGKPKGAPKVIGRGLRGFDYLLAALNRGYEKMLADIDAEDARRNAP